MASVVGDNLSREELLTLVHQQQAQIDALTLRVMQLERELAAARKNSSTSSKPPSGDITGPPPGSSRRRKRKRKIGGQPGHPKHERPPFGPDQVDRVHDHTLNACPDCGGALSSSKEAPRVVQQVEIVARPIRIDEHRGHAYWCNHCQRLHYAPLPPEVQAGGLLGTRLTALAAYLKSACHTSFSTIRRLFGDVLGLWLSRGYLAKLIGKASRALKDAYEALRRRLPAQPRLHVDETGHRENGTRPWTWCFRARDFAVFKIADSRGSDVLREMLTAEFRGVLGCDYFSAYRKYVKEAGVRVQFCLAHLIRDLKFLTTLPDRATETYGGILLILMRDLFRLFHRHDRMSPSAWKRSLQNKRDAILAMATYRVPRTPEARAMAERFGKHGPAYFEFIDTPGLSPTNNAAEQTIRFVVIDRHVTQGTRGEAGRAWSERIWSVLATCAQQGRSAYEFLRETLDADFNQRPTPLLLPEHP